MQNSSCYPLFWKAGVDVAYGVEVIENKLRVAPLEAIDGTPLIDIKPALPESRNF